MPVASRYVVYLSIAVGLVVLATYFLVSTTQGSGEMAHNVFKAPGWWPTSSSKALRAEIERYVEKAEPAKFEGKVAGLIVPHAGYQYSGTVAACGCKLLKQGDYDRVIVLGLSHGVPFRGVSILEDVTHYSTPLGEIEVDRTICDQLLKEPPFTSVPRAHAREHSLANQLPFLQVQLGEFKLVPMLVSDLTPADCDRAAGALRKHVDNRTLVVASSDFTHYGADYRYLPFRENVEENLKAYADQASEAIISLDLDAFRKHLEKTRDTICGRNPLSILIKLLEGSPKGTVVARDFSGRMEGNFARSVTYISIAIPMKKHVSASRGEEALMKAEDVRTPEEDTPAPSPGENPTEEGDVLSHAEQHALLKLARDTLEGYFKNKIPKGPPEGDLTNTLKRELGVFVTLTRGGQLSGCIGYIQEGRAPLYQGVIDNTIHAIRDPRKQLPHVTADTVDETHIEISVMRPVDTPMSPFERVPDVGEIEVGKHGLYLKKDWRTGILLPQVPTEQGWDRDMYLEGICRKADVPSGSWKDPDAELYWFSAQVFGEEGEQ